MQRLTASIVYFEGELGGPFEVSAALVVGQNSVKLLFLFLFTRGAELRQVPIVVSLASSVFSAVDRRSLMSRTRHRRRIAIANAHFSFLAGYSTIGPS
ncbi:hypothetical protein LY76DRAFT_6042 [Colletotrichum caudatum]|nr:hypothetical protein LY76DRAFT_6042 [Colletotrichum caudatum]